MTEIRSRQERLNEKLDKLVRRAIVPKVATRTEGLALYVGRSRTGVSITMSVEEFKGETYSNVILVGDKKRYEASSLASDVRPNYVRTK